MALAQARRVAAALTVSSEVVVISTDGDRWMGSLAAAGGKGAFVREIDRALLDGQIDVAVHCLKDIPGGVPVPDGLALAAYLDREDVHDCVVTTDGRILADLPSGATIATSSVGRQAQLARHWSHLRPVPMRGNVTTRLAKLDRSEVDALILAVSGLRRLDQANRIAKVLPTDTFIPPIGAGVIALQVRADDTTTRNLMRRLNEQTALAASVERSVVGRRTVDWPAGHPDAGRGLVEHHGGSDAQVGSVLAADTALDAAAVAASVWRC